jgi:hypothetical protein
MIRAIVLTAVASGLVLANTGCAPNATVGNGMVMSQQYFADTGFVGHGNNITILAGSHVNKLSIQGDNNTVTVQDDVTIWKVEFWGKNNTVSIPDTLSIRTNSIGANQIIRRPRAIGLMPRYEPAPYTPPATAPPPQTQPPARPAETVRPGEANLPPEADVMENAPPTEER